MCGGGHRAVRQTGTDVASSTEDSGTGSARTPQAAVEDFAFHLEWIGDMPAAAGFVAVGSPAAAGSSATAAATSPATAGLSATAASAAAAHTDIAAAAARGGAATTAPRCSRF